MDRRTLLKAAGATSTIPIVSGVTLATDNHDSETADEEDGPDRECPRPDCIHPTFGYTGENEDEAADLAESLQADHEVYLITEFTDEGQVPEFFFEPVGLRLEPGDVVRFEGVDPEHTVTAYHPDQGRQRRVPADVPAFSSPVLPADAFWLYRFDEPGVYDVFCAPHEIFGMAMRIVVGDAEPDFGEPGPGRRPPEFTAGSVLEDEALSPENILEMGNVIWEELAPESREVRLELPEGEEPPEDGADSEEPAD